jgi:hypothetical protein
MYSSMMTPVWTQTPNSARKPPPDETLKFACVKSSARMPPIGATITFTMISDAHLNERNIV